MCANREMFAHFDYHLVVALEVGLRKGNRDEGEKSDLITMSN